VVPGNKQYSGGKQQAQNKQRKKTSISILSCKHVWAQLTNDLALKLQKKLQKNSASHPEKMGSHKKLACKTCLKAEKN